MVRTTTFADADEIPTVTVSIPHASVEMKGEFIGSGMRKGTASCQDLSEDAARTMQGSAEQSHRDRISVFPRKSFRDCTDPLPHIFGIQP